jgi:hypothetical protein
MRMRAILAPIPHPANLFAGSSSGRPRQGKQRGPLCSCRSLPELRQPRSYRLRVGGSSGGCLSGRKPASAAGSSARFGGLAGWRGPPRRTRPWANGQCAPGSACGARCGARPVPPLRQSAHRPELGPGGPDGGWVVTASKRQNPLVSSDCAAGLNSLTAKFLAQYIRRLVLLARSARPRGPPALALWRSGARRQ